MILFVYSPFHHLYFVAFRETGIVHFDVIFRPQNGTGIRHHEMATILYYGSRYRMSDLIWCRRLALRRRQMSAMASGITGKSSVCSTFCLDWQQRNIKGPCYCPFVRGIHRWPVDSSHKGPVTRKKFHLMTSSVDWLVRWGILSPHCLNQWRSSLLTHICVTSIQ